MNRFLVLFIFLFSVGAVDSRAQSRLPLSQMPGDTAKVRQLLDIVQKINKTNSDSARKLVDHARDISIKLNYKEGIARALIWSGAIYTNKSEYQSAARELIEALKIGEELKNDHIIVKAYLNLGNTYAYSSNYPKALENFEAGLRKAQDSGNKQQEATLLNNIGNIYYYGGYGKDFSICIDHYNRALAIYETFKDTSGIIMALDNLGMAYSDQENFPAALSTLQRSYDLARVKNNEDDLMYLYYRFSRLYARMTNYTKALEMLNQSLAIAEKLNNKDMVMGCYKQFSDIHAAIYDFPNAYKYQRMYSELKDTLLTEDNNRQMTELQAKYESDKKEKELALLKKQNVINELEAGRNRTMAWISIGGGSLLLVVSMVVGLLVYNRYKIKKKANEQLEMQNAIIAQKNKDITDSINYAKRLQRSVITTDSYLQKHLPAHFVLYKPKDIVSGDFYWAHAVNENEVIMAVADCTGHGVPGAFVSVLGASLLNEIVTERKIYHPNLVLNLLRDNIIKVLNPQGSPEQMNDGMDIALCRFNFEKQLLSFSAANHVLWIARGSDMLELKGDKFPVGTYSGELKPFSMKNVQLQKNDMLYLFTDGYADQFGGPQGKKFKYKELQTLLLSVKDKPVDEQCAALDHAFETWKGPLEQVDDVTIVGIRI